MMAAANSADGDGQELGEHGKAVAAARSAQRVEAVGAFPRSIDTQERNSMCGGLRQPCIESRIIGFCPIIAFAAVMPFGGGEANVLRG